MSNRFISVPEKYRIDGSLDNDTKIWSYADGTPISDFHWHPNEPHDDVSRHLCIGLRVAYGLLWDDVLCNNKWGYICEKTIIT
ncbi:hypothetical protein FSP39_017408 [Pinctada imbricata]|uniref:C-type lectin domain-containing protein n=1 Tax=Pinctada imbricata TaxID=66713 RepID=A0AA89BRF2_PINIB|nr:hypothetical protein FSP39_017408 [Pinctada imbricata]